MDSDEHSCIILSKPASVLAMGILLQIDVGIRMTLKSRADTAAAAIVQRMIMRRTPLVFLLVGPRKYGSRGFSEADAAMMAEAELVAARW